MQREKGKKIIRICSDHGKEFDNEDLTNFYQSEGINHDVSAPITPQQNEVFERKNRTLQEIARVMIQAKNLPLNFGQKLLTQHVTFTIELLLDLARPSLYMNFGREESQM